MFLRCALALFTLVYALGLCVPRVLEAAPAPVAAPAIVTTVAGGVQRAPTAAPEPDLQPGRSDCHRNGPEPAHALPPAPVTPYRTAQPVLLSLAHLASGTGVRVSSYAAAVDLHRLQIQRT
jgi:hypothetical protein